MVRSTSGPKRRLPTKDDRDALLLIAGAVDRGALDYPTVLKLSPSDRMRLDKSRITRTRKVFERFLGSGRKRIFGENNDAMEINAITQRAIDWAWNDLRKEFGWEEVPPKKERGRDTLRISTENFLAVHLLSKVLESFKKSDRVIEIRELPSLFSAIDDHVRHQTDLVVYTLRKSKVRSKPAMPRLEGLKPENLSDDTKFRLRDTVWFPRLPEFHRFYTTKEDVGITAADLGDCPVVLVGFPDAARKLTGPHVKKPRIVVDTNEAMRRMVQNGFVGVGHNWPPLPKETAFSRHFEWPRPDIDICLCYRLPKKHLPPVRKFIRALKRCMRGEAKALADSVALTAEGVSIHNE